MAVQEEVLIVLKAKDEVSQVVENIRKTVEGLGKTFNQSMPTGEEFTKPFNDGLGSVADGVETTNYRMSAFANTTQSAGSMANITFSQMAERMDKFHVGLNRVTNAMTGLFGTMGLTGMAHQSWQYATQRQTNQIYLGMRRGTEEARNMYNEIQNIVMELPGDDTFLTTILTQASGRDMDMSIENVRTLGDAIADYYVGATAKGQLSYETQRELTSYILTGETRMFTNSILADEIDLLKNKNSVTERATALQEALNKTGFEGMAHYESATNAMEEFRGHFQKAFADIGSVVLPVIQAVLGVYNALDSLFLNGGISAGIISLATGIALFTTALGTIGFVTPMVNEGIRSVVLFSQGIGNIRANLRDTGSYIEFFRTHITDLVASTRELTEVPVAMQTITTGADTTQNFNAGARGTVNVASWELENGAILTNTEVKLQNTLATANLNAQELALEITKSGLTYSEFLDTVGLDANTTALLGNIAERTGKSEAEILNMAVTSELTTQEFLETLQVNLNTIENELNTIAKETNAEATFLNADATNVGIYSTIRSTIVNAYHTISILLTGSATERNDLINKSALLTDIKTIANSIRKAGVKLYEAFTIDVVSGSKIIEGSVEENVIYVKLVSLTVSIRKSLDNLWEATTNLFKSGTDLTSASTTITETLAKILDTVATTGLTIAEWGLIGATAVLEIMLSPIVLVILAIVGAVYLLIRGFEELGKAFGWWNDLGGMFDAISSGIGRIWDAFVNSEPVQAIITTFQNFAYTMESFFGSLWGILGGIFEVFFGVNQEASGTLDIVGAIITVMDNLLNVIYNFTPIGLMIQGILKVFDAIGGYIGWIMDTWNEFVDSPEMQGLIMEFQEIRKAFGETWQVISEAIGELIDAFGSLFSIFSEDESTTEVQDNGNVLLDVLKGIATLISTVVVPVIRTFADVLKVVAIPIRVLASVIRAIGGAIGTVIGFFTGASDSSEEMGESVENTVSPIASLFNIIQSIVSPIMDFIESIGGLRIVVYGLIYLFNPLLGIVITLLDLANQFGVIDWITDMFGELGNVVGGVLNGVGTFLNNVITGLQWLFNTITGGVGSIDWLSIAFDGLMTMLSPVITLIRTIIFLFEHLSDIGSVIGGVVGFIGQAFNGLRTFLEPVANFINNIVEKFQWVADKLGWFGDAVGGAINSVGEFFSGDTNKVQGQTLGQGDPNLLGLSANDWANVSSKLNQGLVDSNNAYLNRDISNPQSNDSMSNYLRNVDMIGQLNHSYPYDRSQSLASQYQYNQQQQTRTVINNFNEGSVQADARNMSAKDVQKLFTGAFGFNKSRGTKGILN